MTTMTTIDARDLDELRMLIDAKRAIQEQLLVETFQAGIALRRLERQLLEQEADERERKRLERIAGVPLVEVRD